MRILPFIMAYLTYIKKIVSVSKFMMFPQRVSLTISSKKLNLKCRRLLEVTYLTNIVFKSIRRPIWFAQVVVFVHFRWEILWNEVLAFRSRTACRFMKYINTISSSLMCAFTSFDSDVYHLQTDLVKECPIGSIGETETFLILVDYVHLAYRSLKFLSNSISSSVNFGFFVWTN